MYTRSPLNSKSDVETKNGRLNPTLTTTASFFTLPFLHLSRSISLIFDIASRNKYKKITSASTNTLLQATRKTSDFRSSTLSLSCSLHTSSLARANLFSSMSQPIHLQPDSWDAATIHLPSPQPKSTTKESAVRLSIGITISMSSGGVGLTGATIEGTKLFSDSILSWTCDTCSSNCLRAKQTRAERILSLVSADITCRPVQPDSVMSRQEQGQSMPMSP
mmetsp:Transcript_39266/g.80456  ORF Transcript_39266/g.80456 Transcript_39266/m.80456 type:complete len:220 (+) Transcript_39266:422-1081(+)